MPAGSGHCARATEGVTWAWWAGEQGFSCKSTDTSVSDRSSRHRARIPHFSSHLPPFIGARGPGGVLSRAQPAAWGCPGALSSQISPWSPPGQKPVWVEGVSKGHTWEAESWGGGGGRREQQPWALAHTGRQSQGEARLSAEERECASTWCKGQACVEPEPQGVGREEAGCADPGACAPTACHFLCQPRLAASPRPVAPTAHLPPHGSALASGPRGGVPHTPPAPKHPGRASEPSRDAQHPPPAP